MLKILANFVGIMEAQDLNISSNRWAMFTELSKKWVNGNRYIMKNCTKPWALVGFKEEANEIFISLDYFNGEYYDKFIDGKYQNYINGFIEKFKPVLTDYVKGIGKSDLEFTLIFTYRMMSMNKYVTISNNI
ncbi:hypothetical protein [Pedobacter steynii]